MTRLKHAGPIRRASALKRTALIEILSDVGAANESDAFRAIKESGDAEARAIVATPRLTAQQLGADQWGQAEADAAQALELQRMPGGGFLNN